MEVVNDEGLIVGYFQLYLYKLYTYVSWLLTLTLYDTGVLIAFNMITKSEI